MSSSSKTVKFVASHTNTVNASPSEVWAIWSDVSKWAALDPSTHKDASINGAFVPGAVVTLGLRDGKSVKVHLKTVKENKEFSDETPLPSGVVRTLHKLEQSGDNLILTYTVEAEIAAEDAQAFKNGLWQNLVAGVPSQVSNVAALALAA